jgi:Reverse transcriptase (RNA-dependent DNA polymerase)
MAVSVVFSDIARALDSGQICALVLSDLSAAFHTVDHGILMNALGRRFASQDAVKDLFHSYLTSRSQVYHVGLSSVSMALVCGVPQGSIIGSSQFTPYTENVEEIIHVSHHLDADDTRMLSKTTIQSIRVCCQDFETCFMAVQRWCSSRRLQLNPDKTEFICFGSAKQLQHLGAANTSINAAGVDIRPVDSVRNLRVYMGSRLDMRVRSSKIASFCYFNLRRLCHLRHTVDRDTRQ